MSELRARAREVLKFQVPIDSWKQVENDTMTDEVSALREQIAQQQQQLVQMTLEQAVISRRMMPSQREMFFKRHGTGGTLSDAVAWIASAPRPDERFTRNTGPTTLGTDGGSTLPADGPGASLLRMTRQRIADHYALTAGRERLDFGAAAADVVREMNQANPRLVRDWLEAPGEV